MSKWPKDKGCMSQVGKPVVIDDNLADALRENKRLRDEIEQLSKNLAESDRRLDEIWNLCKHDRPNNLALLKSQASNICRHGGANGPLPTKNHDLTCEAHGMVFPCEYCELLKGKLSDKIND